VGGTDGLWRLSGFDQSKAVNVTKGAPVDYRVSKMLSTNDKLWVGTWKGVYTVVEDQSAMAPLQITAIKDTTLSQQYITDIVQDAEQRIWVGTYSAGLFHNTAEGIARNTPWQLLGENDGLPGNAISSIEADPSGNLWVATAQGIAEIDVNTLKVNTIAADQGSAAAPYEDGTITAAGEIVFVGNNGLTIIQPKLLRNSRYQAPIIISHIDSNSAKPLIARKMKDQDGVWRNMLVVSPDINRLTIEFAALDYLAASDLHYRYRLLGFDSHWIETDSKHRAATFTSLSPQVFEMQVQYSLDGTNWQNDTYSLFIDMQPAWYQKLWLHLIILGLGIFIVLLIIRWRTRRSLAYQHLLEQRISERTSELEQANSLLQQQTRIIEEASLTDPLTGLKNRRFFTQHIDADTSLAQRQYLNNYAAPNDLKNADLIFFLIDIDHFKFINDKWGHASGDAVLVEMHHRLQRVFRESDYIVRWGGEEFLAVARGTSRHKAAELAERICQSVSQDAIAVAADQLHTVTCSIGYVAYPFFTDQPSALNWNETLALADAALYSAKQSGRNTWVGFDSTGAHSTLAQISSLKISPNAAFQLPSVTVQQRRA
jgi:diguanylate cyclase (GGDEF)-like protein